MFASLRFLLVPVVLAALAASGANAATRYRVRYGDSLTRIAHRYGTTVAALERLNRLAPGATLLAGSTLRLPAPKPTGRRYWVRPGDTLTGLAERFHTTAAAIARTNGMKVTQTLLIGATLEVPERGGSNSAHSGPAYRVRPGDTLSAIAAHFGVSLGGLADLNHLALSDPLLVGTRLTIPGETLARTAETFARSTVRGSIIYWADHYGVDRRLATALAWMESGFNNELVSPAGAVGVMQITPDTWDYVEQVLLLGRTVPHTPDGNVRIGVALLHHLLRVYGGDERRVLAAYYQGPRSLQVNGFLPGTEQYVDDILALENRF
jgi:LysM repeat protein